MANGNGNGNGYSNGRGGTGASGVFQIAQLASTGVLILGMFGLWWQSADPKSRLDKIEVNQIDNRKELNEVITSLRKDISNNYTSLREHNDLNSRVKEELVTLSQKDNAFVTKNQFEAWKTERDKLVDEYIRKFDKLDERVNAGISRPEHELVLARLNNLETELKSINEKTVSRAEHEQKWISEYKIDDATSHRIDQVVAQIEELRKANSLNPSEILQHRIDQLFTTVRDLQAQLVDLSHGNRSSAIMGK